MVLDHHWWRPKAPNYGSATTLNQLAFDLQRRQGMRSNEAPGIFQIPAKRCMKRYGEQRQLIPCCYGSWRSNMNPAEQRF